MKPHDIATRARALISKRPELEAPMRADWGIVCDCIQQRALARRPLPKSFEVHHETETARKVYLTAWVEGRADGRHIDEALASVGIYERA